MSSGNDAVFQRRNKQIQDAIDGQNLKQALQLIEKRMKKGENTPFLKVRGLSNGWRILLHRLTPTWSKIFC